MNCQADVIPRGHTVNRVPRTRAMNCQADAINYTASVEQFIARGDLLAFLVGSYATVLPHFRFKWRRFNLVTPCVSLCCLRKYCAHREANALARRDDNLISSANRLDPPWSDIAQIPSTKA